MKTPETTIVGLKGSRIGLLPTLPYNMLFTSALLKQVKVAKLRPHGRKLNAASIVVNLPWGGCGWWVSRCVVDWWVVKLVLAIGRPLFTPALPHTSGTLILRLTGESNIITRPVEQSQPLITITITIHFEYSPTITNHFNRESDTTNRDTSFSCITALAWLRLHSTAFSLPMVLLIFILRSP